MDLIEIICSVYEKMEYIIKEMQTIKVNQMKKLIDRFNSTPRSNGGNNQWTERQIYRNNPTEIQEEYQK